MSTDSPINLARYINNWPDMTEYLDLLSPSELSFYYSEFNEVNSLDYYIKRLDNLGFSELENVLDAGCGMGQWSIALSQLNKQVQGIDIHTGRLLFAKSLLDKLNINNLSYCYSPLEKLPYKNETFDGIFCYGVFMFSEMKSSLSELKRVLKPGGRIYINANDMGWYLHLLIDRGIKKKNLKLIYISLKYILFTLLGRKNNIIITRKYLSKLIQDSKFIILDVGSEGSINNLKNENLVPKYPAEYYSFHAINEILAVKS